MGSWRNLVAQFPCKEKVESSNLFGFTTYVSITQMVECHLAMVDVAGSSPV